LTRGEGLRVCPSYTNPFPDVGQARGNVHWLEPSVNGRARETEVKKSEVRSQGGTARGLWLTVVVLRVFPELRTTGFRTPDLQLLTSDFSTSDFSTSAFSTSAFSTSDFRLPPHRIPPKIRIAFSEYSFLRTSSGRSMPYSFQKAW